MKRILAALCLLLCAAGATANTSTVNPNVPQANSPVSSAVIRNNFLATYNDINTIYGLIAGGGGGSPASPTGSLQINGGSGNFGALAENTLYAYAAHNVAENGLSYDPRDPQYGAICKGYNTFAGNGSTTTFTYTIPFTGANSTDNSNFMVFYEPTNGTGSATILNTSQFTVTGVNSGTGGTITLNSAPPAGNTLIVVHDDSAGLVAAATAAVASGGYVSIPDGCTIYGSQASGTQLPEGAQMIGQGFTMNYSFSGTGIKPILRVIAPTGAAPAFGFNVSAKCQQFYEGFEITANVPGSGLGSLGFLAVPVLIGANGASGAGCGQLPGITAQYMTINYGIVGFGAPIGGNSAYIFATLRNNNFNANTAGVYGPLSDPLIAFNDFFSNGAFGAYGSAGGMVIGPQQGAPGGAGAGRVIGNRFEWNSEGLVVQNGSLINFEGNQFDNNTFCNLDLRTTWNDLNFTGGWFRGGALGTDTKGSVTAGKDAHICFNSGAGSGGLHFSNVAFYTNADENGQVPIGTANATTPAYVLDFNSPAANNANITFDAGSALFTATNSGASVTDFAIYRQGRPADLKLNMPGQAVQGEVANGSMPSQARGLPSNSWSGFMVIGDASSNNETFVPLTAGWGGVLAKATGMGPTYHTTNDFSHFDCDIVNLDLVPNVNPTSQSNQAIDWLPSPSDPTYGAGSSPQHEADTNTCRLGGLTWAAVSKDNKVYAQSSGFTNTGTWSNNTAYSGYLGVTSTTNGDTSVGTITTNGGPIYLWYLMQGNSGGIFKYQVDGGALSSGVAVEGNNAFTFPISNSSKTLGAIRIPVRTAEAHTISITVTSATSASNPVTIMGLGTPAGLALHGKQPTVFLAGQIQSSPNYPTAVAAYNTDQMTQATQLAADGLAVAFVPVQQYLNASTDYDSTGKLNASGQGHIAKAFNGVMQAASNSQNVQNPIDYGASCNSLFFTNNYCQTCTGVTLTASSPAISINNYIFQAGTATQHGGGDVGKEICFGYQGNPNPRCTYIASVDTVHNTANLGTNALTSESVDAVMGGYPANPADPSTAQDDTLPIQVAGAAAAINGGKVFLPTNCQVRGLNLPQDIVLEGNAPGDYYHTGQNDLAKITQATVLNCALTGAPDDTVQTCIHATPHTRYSNFLLRPPIFPFTPYGLTGACLGYSNDSASGPNDQLLPSNLSFIFCPTAVGEAYGYNQPVSFTASIADNGDGTSTMTVSSINSTNFWTADAWTAQNGSANVPGLDFLAYGRPVSGAGVTAGTTITSVALGGRTGTYILNKGMTVSSEAMTSAAYTGGMSVRSFHNEFLDDAIAYNGDQSDSDLVDDTCTGTFMSSCLRLGPNLPNFGNGGDRWTGGRMEEVNNNGLAAILCDGCQLVINSLDMDFNGAYNIYTKGAGSIVQMTGGNMYAGGHCVSGDGANTMVRLGGSSASVMLDSLYLEATDFGSGCSGSTNTLFSVDVGATPAFAGVKGGNTLPANSNFSRISKIFDWTNGVPTKYLQDVPGYRKYDSTVSGNGSSAAVGAITGLTLSNDAVTAATIFDVMAGSATSNDGAVNINLPFSITKTTAAWAAGSNAGCLDNGSIAPSSWYHEYVISQAPTTGVNTDILCSLSATAPQLPSGYTHYRRIGSLETDGSSHWIGFTQYGNRFLWNTATLDVNDATLGTTAKSYPLNVPPGVNVNPLCRYTTSNTGNSVILTSPSVTDVAPTTTNPFTAAPGFSTLNATDPAGAINSECPRLTTDNAQSIRARATAASTTLAMVTTGWEENFNQPPALAPAKYFNFMNKLLASELTLTRASTGWFFNSSGNLTSAASNATRFDYGFPGSVVLQGLLLEPQAANSLFQSRDLTQAVWTNDGNETIALNQTGISGVANSASKITATSSNATVCQAVTAPSTCQIGSVYLKRVTGTGNINVSEDGGSTYTTETITGSWARYVLPTQTLSNPQLCIQVATSGDAVAVDAAQLESTRDASGNCFATSPILSTATAGVNEVLVTNAGSGGTAGTYSMSFTNTGTGCSTNPKESGYYVIGGGGTITTTTMTNNGSGCTAPPTVAFNGGGITGATAQAIIGTIRKADVLTAQAWPWYNINQGAYMTQWVQNSLGAAILPFSNFNTGGTLTLPIGISNGTVQAGSGAAGTANVGTVNYSGCSYTNQVFDCATNNTLFSRSLAKPTTFPGVVNLSAGAPYWLQAWYYWNQALSGTQLQAQTAR